MQSEPSNTAPPELTDAWQQCRVSRVDADGAVMVEGDGWEMCFEDLADWVHAGQVMSIRWNPDSCEVELWESVVHGKA